MSSQHPPLQVVPRVRLRSDAGLGFEVIAATVSLHDCARAGRWCLGQGASGRLRRSSGRESEQ